jgi:hypothetical protein
MHGGTIKTGVQFIEPNKWKFKKLFWFLKISLVSFMIRHFDYSPRALKEPGYITSYVTAILILC